MNASMPSPEQLAEIRKYSRLLFGDPETLLDDFTPDRFGASRLILTMDGMLAKSGRVTVEDVLAKAGRINRAAPTPTPTPDVPRLAAKKEDTTMEETRACNHCGEEKPLIAYYKGQGQCKKCLADKDKARRAKKKKSQSKSAEKVDQPTPAATGIPSPRGENRVYVAAGILSTIDVTPAENHPELMLPWAQRILSYLDGDDS